MKEKGCGWSRNKGKSKGRMAHGGEIFEPREQHKGRREQKEEASRVSG